MNITKTEIQRKLSTSLPGIDSQLRMGPKHRAVELEAMAKRRDLAKESAVLILLFAENNKLKVVFIKRAEYDGVHSGQIAFPGGKKEVYDTDFMATALREANEEIGVEPHQVEIIGQLTDLFIPPSNFLVKIFVGYCTQKPAYKPDKREVQAVIEIDLDKFYSESAVTEKEFMAKALNTTIKAPCYSVDNVVIWGATAMIMSELLDTLNV